MKIGIFDSGVGGLTVLQELQKDYKNEYIYIADLINSPYGEKTTTQLHSILISILDYYVSLKVDLIIIACGTLSSLAISSGIKEYKNIKVLNVIDAVTNKLDSINAKKAYLIATDSTVKQGSFERNILKVVEEVKSVGCSKFVPIIESGSTDYDYLCKSIEEYLPYDLIKKFNNTNLVLGCTHYPILKDDIKKYLEEKNLNINIVAPGEAMAIYCKSILSSSEKTNSVEVLTTKNSDVLNKFSKKMLNIDGEIKLINLK